MNLVLLLVQLLLGGEFMTLWVACWLSLRWHLVNCWLCARSHSVGTGVCVCVCVCVCQCVLVFAIVLFLWACCFAAVEIIGYLPCSPLFCCFRQMSHCHGCHFVSERSLSIVCKQLLEEMSMGRPSYE